MQLFFHARTAAFALVMILGAPALAQESAPGPEAGGSADDVRGSGRKDAGH